MQFRGLCDGSDPRVAPVDARLVVQKDVMAFTGERHPGIDQGGVYQATSACEHRVPLLACDQRCVCRQRVRDNL